MTWGVKYTLSNFFPPICVFYRPEHNLAQNRKIAYNFLTNAFLQVKLGNNKAS